EREPDRWSEQTVGDGCLRQAVRIGAEKRTDRPVWGSSGADGGGDSAEKRPGDSAHGGPVGRPELACGIGKNARGGVGAANEFAGLELERISWRVYQSRRCPICGFPQT